MRMFDDPLYLKAKTEAEPNEVKIAELIFSYLRKTALVKANEDDWSEMAQLVREGKPLNQDEREKTARALEGLGQSKAGAPKQANLTLQIGLANHWLVEVDKWPKEAAVAQMKEMFSLSRSSILDRLRKAKSCVVTQEEVAGRRALVKYNNLKVIKYFKDLDLKSG